MNRFLVTASLILLGGAIALSQIDPGQDLATMPAIMRKFVLARKTSRYTGTRTVEFKRGPDRLSHIEYILKDGIRSRTEFPDDSQYKGQVIVDNGKQRMHFFPDRNEIDVEPAHQRDNRPDSGGNDRDSDHKNRPSLQRTVTDGGSVAGYHTQLLTVSDPNGNVMQQMWIEPKTGVRLKMVLYDRVGTQVGSFEFTKINFKPTFAPGDFTIDRKGALIVTPADEARRLSEKLGVTPLILGNSSGYELQNARIIHPDKQDVLAQTYIGDTGRFTFFELRGDIDQDKLQRFARGRLSTYSWKRGQESFAIVGNLTPEQMGEVAKTLGDR